MAKCVAKAVWGGEDANVASGGNGFRQASLGKGSQFFNTLVKAMFLVPAGSFGREDAQLM